MSPEVTSDRRIQASSEAELYQKYFPANTGFHFSGVLIPMGGQSNVVINSYLLVIVSNNTSAYLSLSLGTLFLLLQRFNISMTSSGGVPGVSLVRVPSWSARISLGWIVETDNDGWIA
jgi:hypothetical protein